MYTDVSVNTDAERRIEPEVDVFRDGEADDGG
jgi:hypothetical protein